MQCVRDPKKKRGADATVPMKSTPAGAVPAYAVAKFIDRLIAPGGSNDKRCAAKDEIPRLDEDDSD